MSHLAEYIEIVVRNIRACAVDEPALEAAVGLIARRGGEIVAVGIGKSSFIARKLAASLQSISIQARFLHPAEALHGDVGAVSLGTVSVIISKSGNSQEINALLPLLKLREVRIIALTNVASSPLARAADCVIPLRVTKEGDEHGLLPLTSCQVSLFLCDYLVVRAAASMPLTPELFRLNHPGGQIGFNLSRKLTDLAAWKMRTPFVFEETLLLEALIKISDSKVGMCCVVDEAQRLLGVVTDGDIRRALTAGLDIKATNSKQVMNRMPLTVAIDSSLTEVLNLMECGDRKVACAPVLDRSRKCCGIIQIHDLVN